VIVSGRTQKNMVEFRLRFSRIQRQNRVSIGHAMINDAVVVMRRKIGNGCTRPNNKAVFKPCWVQRESLA